MNTYGDRDFRLVIAIDFGTSRSGYAWVLKGGTHINGQKIWPGQQLKYPKTPTHLLYSPEGELEEWGATVIKKLAQLRRDNQAKDYHFFRDFKMELYEGKNRIDNSPYVTSNGKRFLVIDLIADYLRAMKELALKEINEATNNTLKLSDIRWVITIPAIWKDRDKKLMRKAAQQAGLIGSSQDENDRLFLALEPEAAAIYCQEHDKDISLTKIGTRLMIVDCGGGTVDITVHDKTSNGLKEVIAGTGGSHGSTYVDKSFLEYLSQSDILTEQVIDHFHNEYPQAFVRMMEEWEQTKTSFDVDDDDIYFPLPSELRDLMQKHHPQVLKKLADKQEGDDHTIWLTGEVMKNKIFAPTLNKLVEKVEEIFRKLPDRYSKKKCDIMFLVGGFSESSVLRERIRKRFASEVENGTIVMPQVPSAAIVEGAASFGRNPSVIRSRRSRLTYGSSCSRPFEEGIDPESKKFWASDLGRNQCNNRFTRFISAGDEIDIDKPEKRIYTALERNSTKAHFTFYSTPKQDARYTDESHLTEHKSIELPMPNTTGGIDRQIEITMYFGRTEIEVVAKDLTSGTVVKTQLDASYTYSSEQIGDND